ILDDGALLDQIGELLDVRSSREGPRAGTGNDNRPEALVGLDRTEHFAQIARHLSREQVQRRIIKTDNGNSIVHFELHQAHAQSPFSKSEASLGCTIRPGSWANLFRKPMSPMRNISSGMRASLADTRCGVSEFERTSRS